MELLVGIAVGAIFVIGAATVIAPSLQVNKQAGTVQEEAQLGQEMLGNVRAWAVGDWGGVLALATGTANRYYLNTTSSPFAAVGTSTAGESVSGCGGGSSTSSCATYDRYFYLSDIYRDGSGNATTSAAGNYYDPSTKLATVVVGVASSTQAPMAYSEYITRTGNNTLSQGTWIGGSGVTGPLTVLTSTYSSATSVLVTASGTLQLSTGSAVGGACYTNVSSILGDWPLNEGGSGAVANDMSGNGYNGAWNGTQIGNGGTSYYTTGNNQAYAGDFNGTDDAVVLTNFTGGGFKTFTVAFWVKTTNTATNGTYWQRPTLFGKASSGGASGDFGIVTNNGYIGFWTGLNSGGDNSYLSASTKVNNGNWHFIAVSNDGASSTLYVDGAALGNLATGLALDSTEAFAIGARNDTTGICKYAANCYDSGSIQDVLFYSRALSSSEINTLYSGGTVN
jgi:Concanavalin A-like lectin/glucanases superfamily